MPKSEKNSTRCMCCQRFLPRKAGKRPYCSTSCANTGKASASREAKRKAESRRPRL